MLGNTYTFTIVQKNDSIGNICQKFCITSRFPDISVCALIHYRNTKHPESGIKFDSQELRDSDIYQVVRGGVTPENSAKYYGYIKTNEKEILSAIKTIKSSR